MLSHQLLINSSKNWTAVHLWWFIHHQDLATFLDNSYELVFDHCNNLGVTLDCAFSLTLVNWHACVTLLHSIRSICPFLSIQATQVLVQSHVIVRLDSCDSRLYGRSVCERPSPSADRAWLVFILPESSHTSSLLHSLHWLQQHQI